MRGQGLSGVEGEVRAAEVQSGVAGRIGGRPRGGLVLAAALAGAALLAVLAVYPAVAGAGPRALYVANGVPEGLGTLAQLEVAVPGGGLTPLTPPTVAVGGQPQHVAVTTDGRFAYSGAADEGLVYSYRVRPRNGRLVPLPGAPVPAGVGAHGIVVTPDGRSAYVANQDSGSVSQYDIGAGGSLTPKSPAGVPSGASASGVAITPDGRSAYVTNLGEGTVSQFDIDPASGELTAKTPATIKGALTVSGIGVSPDGRSLYATSLAGHLVQYTIRARDGRLRPKSPATVPAELGSAGIATTPNGRYLYAPNAGADSVSQFAVDRDTGALTPLDPPSVPAPGSPEGAAISPDGRSLYLANAEGNSATRLRIGRGGRLRTPGSTVEVGPSPHGLIVTPNQGPVARLRVRTQRRVVRVGDRVRLSARRSRDRDGSVTRYSWRLGGGQARPAGPASLTRRFGKPGRYRVRVRVTDNERCSARLQYTGQTTSCNGTQRARASRLIRVRPAR